MKAVLFDLDNTLYNELDFVKSGFKTVTCYISSRYGFDEGDLFEQLIEILENDGRGKVFDTLLKNLGLYSQERVNLLLYLYRSHYPVGINLYDETLPMLNHLINSNINLGIITDGVVSVQSNKVKSLGLDKLFKVIVYTDILGKVCRKPSTTPFKVALELLGVAAPSEAVYVGDDPSKDFLGPSSLGMPTIRINRPTQAGSIPVTEAKEELAEAKFVIRKLSEILPIVFKGKR